MAMETRSDISVDGSSIVIDNLEIDDPDVVNYVSERDEETAETVRMALRVGVSTLRLSDTTEEVEFVRQEFDKVNRELQEEIGDLRDELEQWFDHEDGDFAEIMDDHFGEDGSLVQEVFDPSRDGTPLEKLRSELERELQDMRDSLLEDEVREEVEQKTTKKGKRFEDDLQELLGDVTRRTDEVHRTGQEHGQLDDRYVGDFVVTIGETGQDILVEAKDVSQLTKPTIKEELEEGMENRGADYGILVLKDEDAASNFLGSFREFDQRMLYVAISDSDSDTYDKRLLNLGLEWARMRTLSSQIDTGDDVNPEVIREKIHQVEDSLADFRNIRTQCTNIKNARKKIEDEVDSIEREVEEQLDEISDELSAATDSR